MCGIVGIINVGGRLTEHDLAVLNETLARRGPDGSGLYWDGDGGLAMRRLAIIDLEEGDQPVYSEDECVVVVMNGEIYNYLRLRAQLMEHGHRFRSQGDTEVLVHGYEQWGIDGLLERLDGMFAFALWDTSRRRLFLARDRFGEKPLYVAREDGAVVFGSQLLTVVSALERTPPLDADSLQRYWALHFVPGDRTIFERVNRLRPGEAYEIESDTGRIRRRWRYWALREHRERDLGPNELRQLLMQAVESRLVADVPVGVFLSGGVDSSLLAILAATQVPGIHTFSAAFESAAHDESPYASEVAQRIGASHHVFTFGVGEFRDLIPAVVATMDEPVGDQAMLPLFALAREASKYVKVVLSGEGADELFAGYSYYEASATTARPISWRSIIRRGRSGSPRVLTDDRTGSGFPLVTPTVVRTALSRGLLEGVGEGWHDELAEAMHATHDPLRRATLCDVETWLSEDLLMKADKMTMAHSLESRAPYLMPELAQAAFGLPGRAKIDGGHVKVRLRESARPVLPKRISRRAKQGFVLPMDEWLRRDLHEEFVAAIRSCREPLIDTVALERAVLADRVGEQPLGGRALYPMLIMVLWLAHADQEVRHTRSRLSAAGTKTSA
jgi:asparagine synthase (glutamine-hydrolysing)